MKRKITVTPLNLKADVVNGIYVVYAKTWLIKADSRQTLDDFCYKAPQLHIFEFNNTSYNVDGTIATACNDYTLEQLFTSIEEYKKYNIDVVVSLDKKLLMKNGVIECNNGFSKEKTERMVDTYLASVMINAKHYKASNRLSIRCKRLTTYLNAYAYAAGAKVNMTSATTEEFPMEKYK